MEQPTRSRNRRRVLYFLGGLVLLAAGVGLLEMVYPRSSVEQELPPIRPRLERVNDRLILIDAGLIDRLSFPFDDEESVEYVDGIYRCLEQRLEQEFGPESDPQGNTRWSRRLEVGRRLREIQDRCLE